MYNQDYINGQNNGLIMGLSIGLSELIEKDEPVLEGFQFRVKAKGGVNRAYWSVMNMPDYTVDFGDGNIRRIGPATGDYNTNHTYTVDGEYIIKMTEVGPTGQANVNETWLDILSPFPYLVEMNTSGGILSDAENLRTICKRLFINNTHMTDMTQIFASTPANVVFPEELFYGCENITSMYMAFQRAEIKTLPTDLLKYSPKINNISFMFQYSKVESVPDDLFGNCHNITEAGWCFDQCSYLKNMPSVKTLIGVSSFNCFFTKCYALEKILTESFDNLTVTNFTACFENCSSMKGNAPLLWEMFPNASGAGCFYNCSSLSNYIYIPPSWGGPSAKLEVDILSGTLDGEYISIPATVQFNLIRKTSYEISEATSWSISVYGNPAPGDTIKIDQNGLLTITEQALPIARTITVYANFKILSGLDAGKSTSAQFTLRTRA